MPRVTAAREWELESHHVMVRYAVSAKTVKAANQTSASVKRLLGCRGV
jgi:hypothetical protein